MQSLQTKNLKPRLKSFETETWDLKKWFSRPVSRLSLVKIHLI